MSPDVKRINPNGVAALARDVDYLTKFVEGLGVPILLENLDELQQTVQLMMSDNTDEFYDISIRNKKYGRVDAMNGPILIEKYASAPCSKYSLNDADVVIWTGLHEPCKVHLQKPTSSARCLADSG